MCAGVVTCRQPRQTTAVSITWHSSRPDRTKALSLKLERLGAVWVGGWHLGKNHPNVVRVLDFYPSNAWPLFRALWSARKRPSEYIIRLLKCGMAKMRTASEATSLPWKRSLQNQRLPFHVSDCMLRLFRIRRDWIEKESPSIQAITDEYPSLKLRTIVITSDAFLMSYGMLGYQIHFAYCMVVQHTCIHFFWPGLWTLLQCCRRRQTKVQS